MCVSLIESYLELRLAFRLIDGLPPGTIENDGEMEMLFFECLYEPYAFNAAFDTFDKLKYIVVVIPVMFSGALYVPLGPSL